jgi:uncharacterized protein YutE (UPF0331/DUF86 family)
VSPIEVAVVRRKLMRIRESLETLRRLLALPALDEIGRAALERSLQTCIDAAIDVNGHLLVGSGHPPPANSHQSFLDLAGRLRLLPEDLSRELAPSAGLRNRLVHRYDELDDGKVLEGARNAVRLFPRYATAVEALVT